MNVNVPELLKECGVEEPLYPGKRLVQKMPQPGEFKSHCVVYDWRKPDTLHIEVKAGHTGNHMEPKDLAKYPVSFQAATFVDIDVSANDDDSEEEGSSGKKGGGGKGLKKKKLNEALNAFSEVVEGKIPELGDIKRMVVMGKEIAKEAFGPVMEALTAQISAMKITPTDILSKAGKFITKYAPPAALAPKGDEDKPYKYDREKNAPMFGGMAPGG